MARWQGFPTVSIMLFYRKSRAEDFLIKKKPRSYLYVLHAISTSDKNMNHY